MEYMQKKYEPSVVLHKGYKKSSRDFHSPTTTTYVNEEMIDIMNVWKANYQHHLQYHLDYPEEDDVGTVDHNCNNNNNNSSELSSVTGVIRTAVQKAGVQLQEDKRRVSRQFLTNLSIAQLQVIVNDLQRYIELLNDELVQLLMERDELQMSQDATLIDIEDLSLYF